MRTKDTILLENLYSKVYEDVNQDTTSDVSNPQPDASGTDHQGDVVKQLTEFLSKRGASFASFMYKSKGDGATSVFNVNLNVDYKRAKEEDLEKVRAYEPQNDLEAEAKESILNPKTRKAPSDPYERLGQGVLLNKTNNKIHIYGWLKNKEVISAGEKKKEVNSRPLTIAKNDLCKKLDLKSMGPTRKIRNFILDPAHVAGLRLNGGVIEFQYEE